MKKANEILIIILVLMVLLFLIYFINKNTGKINIEKDYGNKIVYTTDVSKDKFNYINDCKKRSGTFNECGNVCSSDAELCIQICAFTCDNISSKNIYYCSDEERNADVCTQIYSHVCGWFKENIKCIKYPCASAYSNRCEACKNKDVLYLSDGKCPI